MKHLPFLAVATLFLCVAALDDHLGVMVGTLAWLSLGIGMALCASQHWNAWAVAAGALGALTAFALRGVSSAAGGAALATLVFAERTHRVRDQSGKVAHLLLALVGGALAGQLTAAYSGTGTGAVLAVAVAVGTALLALPMLLLADNPLATRLTERAAAVSGRAKALLSEGAELRRHTESARLDPDTRRSVMRTFSALERLADAQVSLEPRRHAEAAKPVLAMVETKIEQHVHAIRRILTAANSVHITYTFLDTLALDDAKITGESLEEVSRQLAEPGPLLRAPRDRCVQSNGTHEAKLPSPIEASLGDGI